VLIDDDQLIEYSARRRSVAHHDLVEQVTVVVGPEHRRGRGEDVGRRKRLRGS